MKKQLQHKKTQQPIQRAIFDLDRTLFNTERLKDMLRNITEAYGYSLAEEKKLYEKAFTSRGKITFTFERYREVLRNSGTKNRRKGDREAKKIYSAMRKSYNRLLLPGAENLLLFCKRKKLETYLLTLGAPKWQKQKIAWSGLRKFFPEEHIIVAEVIETKKGKAVTLKRALGRTFTGKNTAFFNDEPKQTEEMLQAFPELTAFLRYERRDTRVSRKDFETLKKKYPKRVWWSDELRDLQKILQKTLNIF